MAVYQKRYRKKVNISNCCSLCTNRSNTHLCESVISKFFPGLYPDPFSRGGGRNGEGREGNEKVRREGTGKNTG
jgi:hypothetical protein